MRAYIVWQHVEANHLIIPEVGVSEVGEPKPKIKEKDVADVEREPKADVV